MTPTLTTTGHSVKIRSGYNPGAMTHVDAYDRDTLHILPLHDIPLNTPALRTAAMVKNSHLESVIELFRDRETGSGQIAVNDLTSYFPDAGEAIIEDQKVLKKLAELQSFDVYSLRIQLRKIGVDLNSVGALKLTPDKTIELRDATRQFTRPLMERLFGYSSDEDKTFHEIINSLEGEERVEALMRMKAVSHRMNMKLEELPDFIESCGDLYLSIAYYESSLKTLLPVSRDFMIWMREIRNNSILRRDPNVSTLLDDTGFKIRVLTNSVNMRLSYFKKRFIAFWDDVDPDSYHRLKAQLLNNHSDLGAVLCGLTVKMDRFDNNFPYRKGALKRRLEFIRSDIIPGLDALVEGQQNSSEKEFAV